MKKNFYITLFAGIVVIGYLFLKSCKHDPFEPGGLKSDDLLHSLSQSNDLEFYKNDPSILPGNSGGAHSNYVRVKFNTKARSALDASGKLPAGASFPDSSLVVKEIYDSNGGPVKVLAVMYKTSTSPNQAEGWLWGEYEPDGKVFYSATKKGAACTSCHQNNYDFVRIFDVYP